MEGLMQERYNAEPEWMAKNEKMQQLAAQMFLAHTEEAKKAARQTWEQGQWESTFNVLVAPPTEEKSLNRVWNAKSAAVLSFYKVRPIVIGEERFKKQLNTHVKDLMGKPSETIHDQLPEVYAIMARRIFENHLDYDILCLQEADFLNPSFFPSRYEAVFSEHLYSRNAIAWNKEIFEHVADIGSIMDRALLVQLRHKPSGKELIVVSGHFTGCHPYKVELDPKTGGQDSARGDQELTEVLKVLNTRSADLKILAADTNVTAFHPRLRLLYDAGYRADYQNFLEPTCCSPYLILNTRIDWIFFKSAGKDESVITNIPVLNVSLNNLQNNISDHKPVASRIRF